MNEELLQTITQKGLGLQTQEALGIMLGITAEEGKHAHTSEADVQVLAQIFDKLFIQTDDEDFFKDTSKPTVLKGDSTQLLYAMSGVNPRQYGLIGYFNDPLTNELRTFDGYILDEDARPNFFAYGGIWKGVSYTITDIASVSTSDKFREVAAQHYPNLDIEQLIAVKFQPVTDSDDLKSLVQPVIIGSKTDVMNYINHNLIHTASRKRKKTNDGEIIYGKWRSIIGDDKVKSDLLSVHKIDKHGKLRDDNKFTVSAQLKESTRKLTESSNELNREKNARKDLAALRYLTARAKIIDEYLEANPQDSADRKQLEKEIDSEFLENTKNVIANFKLGKTVSAEEIADSFVGYFGYQLKEQQPNVLFETISKQLNRLPYVQQNQNLMLDALMRSFKKVDGIEYSDEELLQMSTLENFSDKVNFYYRGIMSIYENTSILKYNGTRSALGEVNVGLHTYEMNSFDIDMSGYKGINGVTADKFITIRDNESGESIVRKLLKMQDRYASRESDQAKLTELAKFQRFLIETGQFRKFADDNDNKFADAIYGVIDHGKIDKGTDFININTASIDSAGANIVYLLQRIHEINPAYGRKRETVIYDVNKSKTNMGLSTHDRVFRTAAKDIEQFLNSDIEFFNIPSDKNLRQNRAKDVAEIITKNALFNIFDDDIINYDVSDEKLRRELIETWHYTPNQAEKLLAMHRIRCQDTVRLLTKIIDASAEYGVSFGLDKRNKQLFAFSNSETRYLKYVPQATFEGGRLGIKLGNQNLLANVGFLEVNSYGKTIGDLTFASTIRKDEDAIGWLHTSLKRGSESGNILSELEQFFSSAAKPIRETATAYEKDIQNTRAQFDFSYDVLPKFLKYYSQDLIDKQELTDGKLIKLLQNYEDGFIDFQNDIIFQQNAIQIVSAMSKRLDEQDNKLLMNTVLGIDDNEIANFSTDNKHSYRHEGTFGQPYNAGEDLFGDSRGVSDFMARAIKFRTVEVNSLDDIKFGETVSSEFYAKQAAYIGEGINADVSNAIRLNRARVTNATHRNIVNSIYYLNDAFVEQFAKMYGMSIDISKVADILTASHLDEGNAIIDPEILDTVFRQRASTQEILMNRVLDYDGRNLIDIEFKRQAMPTISVSNKGVTFKSGEGAFAEEGEVILHSEGTRGLNTAIHAKETGLYRITFESKSAKIKATDEDIESLLNSEKYRTQIFDVPVERRNAKIWEILNDVYDVKYSSIPLAPRSSAKLAEQVEKGMYNAHYATIGAFDNRIRQVFENLSIWNKCANNVFGIEFVQSINDSDLSKSFFGKFVARAKGEKSVGVDDILKAINKAGFDTFEDFYNAVMQERYLPWRLLQQVYSDPGFGTIHAISNQAAGESKHADVSSMFRAFDDLLNSNKYNGDLNKLQQDLSPYFDGLKIVDNHFVMEQGNIYLSGFEQFLNDSGIAEIAKVDIGNFGVGYKGFAQFKLLPDQDKQRVTDENLELGDGLQGKGVRLNFRAQAQLKAHRYDENVLNHINSFLADSLGADNQRKIFDAYFKDVKVGDYVNQAFSDILYSRMYNLAGTNEYRLFDAEVDNSQLNEEMQRGFKSLADAGIPEKFTNSVIAQSQSNGIKRMTHGAVKRMYQTAMYASAKNFNSGVYSLQDMQHLNFGTPVPIKDVFTAVGQDRLNQEIDNSLFGKNLLVDLHLDILGDNQIYTETKDRYLALPWTDIQYFAGDEIATDYQRKFKSLVRTIDNYENDPELREKKSDTIRAELRQKIADIKGSISNALTAKNGLIADSSVAVLPNSNSFKASGMSLRGITPNQGFWGNLKFEDIDFDSVINLSEQASKGSKGLNFDYVIVSSALQQKYFSDDYFKNLGLDNIEDVRRDVFKYLGTTGTYGSLSRFPQGYPSSTVNTMLIFSDAVTDNTARVADYTFEKMKGDYDSDELHISMQRAMASITHNGKQNSAEIDYATFKALQNRNIDVQLSDDAVKLFRGIEQSMIYNADYINPTFAAKMIDDNTVATNPYDFSYLYKKSVEGSKYAGLKTLSSGNFHNATQQERLFNIATYTQTISDTRSAYKDGADAFDALDFENTRAAYMNYIDENLSGDDYRQTKDALAYHNRANAHMQDTATHVRKGHAGEINNLAFKYFRATQMLDYTGQDLLSIAHMHSAINEAFLSPKNETGVGDIELVDRFRNAFNEGYRVIAQPDSSLSAVNNARNKIEYAIRNVLESRANKEIAHIPGLQLDSSGNVQKHDIERLTKLFSSVIGKAQGKQFDLNALNIGVKENMANKGLIAYINTSDDLLFQFMRDTHENMKAYVENLRESNPDVKAPKLTDIFTETSGLRKINDRSGRLRTANIDAWNRISNYGLNDTAPIVESSNRSNFAPKFHVSNKSFAIGIAGIAASLALSGYANSATSNSMPTPAETQAAGQAEYEQNAFAPPPTLSDGNLNVMRGADNKSYIINIRADSPRGRHAAESAISQATMSTVPQNSAININSNVTYNDRINSLYINSVLENMIA